MILEEGLQIHLNEVDECWVKVRSILTDPEHVNQESKENRAVLEEMKIACNLLWRWKEAVGQLNHILA